MDQPSYIKIALLAETAEAIEKSISYMQENLRRFLKKNEKVLLLFPKQENASCRILEQAVLACECIPIWIGKDFRWMTLLKTAFTTRSSCIVGPPLMLLGLSKLSKQMGIPLSVKNVLMSGYPTTAWLVEGVRQGLDCMAWGCFDPGNGAVIAGFTCPELNGVHIRDELYTVEIVDENDHPVPEGEAGRVVLYPKAEPDFRFAVGDEARMDTRQCSCGCRAPKLVNIDTVKMGNEELSELGESLHYWSSILDCRMVKSECGLELEMIVFPGEKLPKLPTTAKLVIRPFDPETDEPFGHQEELKKRYLYPENH